MVVAPPKVATLGTRRREKKLLDEIIAEKERELAELRRERRNLRKQIRHIRNKNEMVQGRAA